MQAMNDNTVDLSTVARGEGLGRHHGPIGLGLPFYIAIDLYTETPGAALIFTPIRA